MIIFIKDLHAQPIEAFELSFEALSYSSQIFCFEGTCFKTKKTFDKCSSKAKTA